MDSTFFAPVRGSQCCYSWYCDDSNVIYLFFSSYGPLSSFRSIS
ncbi:hypothetical protein WG66_016296 [Moniliophthora roreri]|nr:hypothetical protein WG66_016296 [Moniliophthora roreri]